MGYWEKVRRGWFQIKGVDVWKAGVAINCVGEDSIKIGEKEREIKIFSLGFNHVKFDLHI